MDQPPTNRALPSSAPPLPCLPRLWGLLRYCEACICLCAFLFVYLHEWSHTYASFGICLLPVMSSGLSGLLCIAVVSCRKLLLMVSWFVDPFYCGWMFSLQFGTITVLLATVLTVSDHVCTSLGCELRTRVLGHQGLPLFPKNSAVRDLLWFHIPC